MVPKDSTQVRQCRRRHCNPSGPTRPGLNQFWTCHLGAFDLGQVVSSRRASVSLPGRNAPQMISSRGLYWEIHPNLRACLMVVASATGQPLKGPSLAASGSNVPPSQIWVPGLYWDWQQQQGRKEERKSGFGHFHLAYAGGGSRKMDRKFSFTPPPNFPFLQFLPSTLPCVQGNWGSCPTWLEVRGESKKWGLVHTPGWEVGI